RRSRGIASYSPCRNGLASFAWRTEFAVIVTAIGSLLVPVEFVLRRRASGEAGLLCLGRQPGDGGVDADDEAVVLAAADRLDVVAAFDLERHRATLDFRDGDGELDVHAHQRGGEVVDLDAGSDRVLAGIE